MSGGGPMLALNQALHRLAPVGRARRIGPIGLECALERLHLIQLEADQKGSIRVRARVSLPYAGGPEALLAAPGQLRALVQQALKTGGFHRRHAVSAVPSPAVRIVPLSYQVAAGQDDGTAILELMRDRLDGDLADYVLDFIPIRSAQKSDQRVALVTSARRALVIDYLEALRKAGLEVDRLEVGPVAIRRLVAAMAPAGHHQNVLVINFGSTTSYLTIVSGNRLLSDQQIQFSERQLVGSIAHALDMPEAQVRALVARHSLDPADTEQVPDPLLAELDVSRTLNEIIMPSFLELAEEINRVLIYVASETHGESVDRIYLLGSVARWRGADSLLNNLLAMPVETIPNPLKTFLRPGAPEAVPETDPAPEIAVATGLALAGLVENDD